MDVGNFCRKETGTVLNEITFGGFSKANRYQWNLIKNDGNWKEFKSGRKWQLRIDTFILITYLEL